VTGGDDLAEAGEQGGGRERFFDEVDARFKHAPGVEHSFGVAGHVHDRRGGADGPDAVGAFLTQIQALRPGVQVLFMSGYERPADMGDGWPDATTQVIGKPFSRAALLARIAQVIAGIGVRPGERVRQAARGERAPQPVRIPRQ
jgi:hypothetical protein